MGCRRTSGCRSPPRSRRWKKAPGASPVPSRRWTEAAMQKLVVMGVAGSGKSVLAERLARTLGWGLVEGDDFHPAASQDKMRAGIPLSDADREPWLDRLGAMLATPAGGMVLSCSALKRRYRE